VACWWQRVRDAVRYRDFRGPGRGLRGPPPGRRGAILPAALLLLLAGTLMATSLLVMARSAAYLADGDRHLARALVVRSVLRAGPHAGGWLAGDPQAEGDGHDVAGEEPIVIPLAGGYRLLASPAPGVEWRVWDVGWSPRPDVVAGGLNAAAEAGHGEGELEGQVMGAGPLEGCPDFGPLDPWRIRSPDPEPAAEPALPPHPRLGPLSLADLAPHAEVRLDGDSALPGSEEGRLLLARPGARIRGGSGRGLLVAPGDLELSGDARFEGLVLVAGDVALGRTASVHGAVRAAEGVQVGPDARILGCRAWVEEALAGLQVTRITFSVPGSPMIGRY
jgi:hypothetical protein